MDGLVKKCTQERKKKIDHWIHFQERNNMPEGVNNPLAKIALNFNFSKILQSFSKIFIAEFSTINENL